MRRPLYTTGDQPITSNALTVRNDAVFVHFLAGEMWTMDHRADLADVAYPVLVLSGEQDPVCSPPSTEELVAAVPDAHTTWMRFEHSAHTIAADEPDAFSAGLAPSSLRSCRAREQRRTDPRTTA